MVPNGPPSSFLSTPPPTMSVLSAPRGVLRVTAIAAPPARSGARYVPSNLASLREQQQRRAQAASFGLLPLKYVALVADVARSAAVTVGHAAVDAAYAAVDKVSWALAFVGSGSGEGEDVGGAAAVPAPSGEDALASAAASRRLSVAIVDGLVTTSSASVDAAVARNPTVEELIIRVRRGGTLPSPPPKSG